MRKASRSVRLLILMLALAAVAGGCSSRPTEVRSLADFDANPCALFTDAAMASLVEDSIRGLTGVPVTLVDTNISESSDTVACSYFFEAKGSAVPQVSTLSVTVAHELRGGSQPLAICLAGAANRTAGYKVHEIADVACTNPTSDLWMRIGENFFHVVVVAQPGFPNPVDNSLALSPLILAVARATADRMPKS